MKILLIIINKYFFILINSSNKTNIFYMFIRIRLDTANSFNTYLRLKMRPLHIAQILNPKYVLDEFNKPKSGNKVYIASSKTVVSHYF